MGGLNLTKYVGELASALLEARLKMADVTAAVEFCSAVHQKVKNLKLDYFYYYFVVWFSMAPILDIQGNPFYHYSRLFYHFHPRHIFLSLINPNKRGMPAATK